MKKRKKLFGRVYLIYVSVLAALVAFSLVYVNSLLTRYEKQQPENRVREAADMLAEAAGEADFWSRYAMPEVEAGYLERGIDIKAEYLKLCRDSNVEIEQKSGSHKEDELFYILKNRGMTLAEVALRAKGPAETRLVVLSFRDWEIAEIKPVLQANDYTLTLPDSFRVSVNGIALTEEDGIADDKSDIAYTLSGLYLEPRLDIRSGTGEPVSYSIRNEKITADFYQYTLTLPDALQVMVNGELREGEQKEETAVFYNIIALKEPVVEITDYYGNKVAYDGSGQIPLTFMTIKADSRCQVTVDGQPVPDRAVTTSENPVYSELAPYVSGLPGISLYEIAVLEDDARVQVLNPNGEELLLEGEGTSYDFSSKVAGLADIPDEVSAEVDVLEAAQKWSLFMSRDLPFAEMKQYLIAGSYQYQVASKYANGIDITFISNHTLPDPTFTENQTTNFAWITENSFSVDISFVKHMYLVRTGSIVDDVMNDRFYFVKYDDTNDHIDNPTWKIVCMKEIVDNEN